MVCSPHAKVLVDKGSTSTKRLSLKFIETRPIPIQSFPEHLKESAFLIAGNILACMGTKWFTISQPNAIKLVNCHFLTSLVVR